MKARASAVAIFAFLVEMAYSRPSILRWANFSRQRPKAAISDDYRMLWIRSGSLGSEKWWHSKVDAESDFPAPDTEGLESLSLLGSGMKSRHCSDIPLDLRRRATVTEEDNEESLVLRKLVASRSLEYLDALRETQSDTYSGSKPKLPHPRKLLHFLAPKIPAIKHSPNVNLRIHSARSDIDSGIAACVIATVAHVIEEYDKAKAVQEHTRGVSKSLSTVNDLISDRRFEQLVECVSCGINLKKRKREALQRSMEAGDVEDIEDLLDEESPQESEGLSIRDACRASWGMAILGVHQLETMGGEQVIDILEALSLRTRELLLARLKLLRQDDLFSEPGLAHITIEERMDELALELAEDAASALWAFACVQASTGLRSVPLFETCCSILCQDPFDLRRRAQEVRDDGNAISVGNNDAVDRLAMAESGDEDSEEVEVEQNTSSSARGSSDPAKDTLLDWLSVTQLSEVVWALAQHGRDNATSSGDDLKLSEAATALGEIALDRLVDALEDDLKNVELENEVAKKEAELTPEDSVKVDVVDAAALLATQGQGSSQVPIESMQMLPVESMTLTVSSFPEQVHHSGVVDTAGVVASERDSAFSIAAKVMEILTPSRHERPESLVEAKDSADLATERMVESDGCTPRQTIERTFSPHDLASIAWAVVELHDPLRMQVLPIVMKLVAMLGESGTELMSGADLSNLAWAVSKFEAETPVDVAVAIHEFHGWLLKCIEARTR